MIDFITRLPPESKQVAIKILEDELADFLKIRGTSGLSIEERDMLHRESRRYYGLTMALLVARHRLGAYEVTGSVNTVHKYPAQEHVAQSIQRLEARTAELRSQTGVGQGDEG